MLKKAEELKGVILLSSNKRECGILTVSDSASKGIMEDKSGPFLINALEELNYKKKFYEIVEDDLIKVETILKGWCRKKVELIITTGGTGFSKRDITPEATLRVITKFVPGISEAIRQKGLEKTPKAMLSRAVSGFSNNTLIINLPGSINAVKDGIDVLSKVLDHSFDMRDGKGH